jgi:putative hydrolase of the HAD superfamily
MQDPGVTVRAVVFDLWGTLVRWPREESERLRERWAERLGLRAERLEELWYAAGAYEERECGPLLPFLNAVRAGAGSDRDVGDFLEWRVDLARHALVADGETIAALDELRRRRIRLGLVSNCTEDVAIVWPETELASRFDVAVFSATAGVMKPDGRIYERAWTELGVEPSDCLFVGDGANDELAGARRVGMTPVLIHEEGQDPVWDGLRGWRGARITSIPQVLDLLG